MEFAASCAELSAALSASEQIKRFWLVCAPEQRCSTRPVLDQQNKLWWIAPFFSLPPLDFPPSLQVLSCQALLNKLLCIFTGNSFQRFSPQLANFFSQEWNITFIWPNESDNFVNSWKLCTGTGKHHHWGLLKAFLTLHSFLSCDFIERQWFSLFNGTTEGHCIIH